MKIQRQLLVIYGVIITGVIAVAILGFMLKTATDRMDAYHEQRYVSNLLADELRQSSDDLTRFARMYVLTGDAQYKKRYWEVLAIRNGKKPRPDHYERIYWDLVLHDNGRPRPDSAKAVSLRELMERAGFTEAEFAKLAEAQKNSDGLVKTEETAMNMVNGRYDDGSGNFTKTGPPDPQTARTLLHDAAYHQTKASIMKPIEEFQEMLDERTRQVTTRSFKRTKTIFWALQSILLGLFFSAALLLIRINRQQELELVLSRSLLAEVEERKRAEESLRSSSDTLQALVNSSPLAIVTFDKDGNIGMWNPAAERMFGWKAEEAVGRPHPIVPEDKRGEFREFREVALGGGTFTGRELRRLRKDGSYIDISVSTAPLRDAAGSITSVMSIITDITGRKQAEEDRERLQDQLQQAMKMEAVGRLAGGVAHDFNNLLTVITGYGDLLLQKVGKGSPMRGELEEIKRAGDRAASLTQQLLAFSRKQIIEPKVAHLDRLVAEVHAMLARLIGEDVALQIITCKAPGSVKVDPGQFQQILMNLAVNARDAMPGGGKITVETANVELNEGYCAVHPYVTPGRFVMLSVSDTGMGMGEEVKARIFEPFFTTKELGRGTGLGLATTYGAVRQAGGSIEVDSEVGKGTTFRIYLPRVEEEAAKPVEDDLPRDLPVGSDTVLLVEDEDVVRVLCVQVLEQLGYKVLQAGNGAEAIALAQGYGDRIHLLLTDVVMPGMSGNILATQLVLHHPEMKVLFMSGYTDDAIGHHGVLDEGVSFIGKPYSPERLARKVREVLDKTVSS